MSETTNVTTLAGQLALLLPGGMWTVVKQGSYWVSLTDNDPQAPADISLSLRDGRYHISANYPKDSEPYIGGRGRVYRESITVSASKPAATIARDIVRRLFSEAGYLDRLSTCYESKRASETRQAHAEAIAHELRDIIGASHPLVPEDNSEWGMKEHHEQSRKVHVYEYEGPVFTGVSIEVPPYGSTRMKVELDGLTVHAARLVLRQLAALVREAKRESGKADRIDGPVQSGPQKGPVRSAGRCGTCGERWPCADSARHDITGIERARHYRLS